MEAVKDNQVETPEQDMDRLRTELFRLSIQSLVAWLERFGYQVEGEKSKAKLVEAILKLEKIKLDDAAETTAKATADTTVPDDPIVEMIFQNLECPGADIQFTYQKGGFKVSEKGTTKPAPKWHFFPGRTYKVPFSVVKHLNSLEVPADRNVNTTGDGMISSLYSGEKQKRFACQVELSDSQVSSLGKST